MATQTAFRLDDDLRGMLKEAAKDGRPMAWHVDKALRQYFGKSKPKAVSKAVAPPKQEMADYQMDEMFDAFWGAGMRKASKQAARKAFEKFIGLTVKKFDAEKFPHFSGDKWEIVNVLICDIKDRLQSDQLGFPEMHPATYLNNQRFNDEIRPKETGGNQNDAINSDGWAEGLGDLIGQPDDGGLNGQLPGVEEFGCGQQGGFHQRIQAPIAGSDDREQCQLGLDGQDGNGQG